jgi:hypothetical protein
MEPRKSALIIASSDYRDPELRKLLAPAQDALALAEVLRNPRVGGFEVTSVIDQPSHEVCQAIETFLDERKPDDLVVLYFSGHGVKDEDGQLYLATIDTQLNHSRLRRTTAIDSVFVNEAMRRCRSRRQVLLLDCCYSGAFAESMLAKGGGAVDTKRYFEGKGRIVLTASNALQYSFEDDKVEGVGVRSYFTSALVHGLTTGEADLDRDGLFSLDEVYEYVLEKLADDAPQQRPMKVGTFEGKLVLAQNPLVKPAELSAEIVEAMRSGLVSSRLVAVTELARLCKGPNQPLRKAARQALEKLVEDDSRDVSRRAEAALKTGGEGPLVEAPPEPAPIVPQPAVSQPVVSQPAVPRPVAPQPVVPQPVMPQPVVPQPVVPQPVAPIRPSPPVPAGMRSSTRKILFACLALGAVMLTTLVIGAVVALNRPHPNSDSSGTGGSAPPPPVASTPEAVVHAFIFAVGSGNYSRAFDYFSAGLKESESVEHVRQLAHQYADRFMVMNTNFSTTQLSPTQVQVNGFVLLRSGRSMPVQFMLIMENDEWRIMTWRIGN